MCQRALQNVCAFLVPLAAAFSLTAPAANAEALTDGGKTGLFLVNKEAALAGPGVTFEANQVGTSALTVKGRVGILCKTGLTRGEFKNDTEALGNAQFSDCTAWAPVNLEEGKTHAISLPCTVTEPIKVAKVRFLPKLHEAKPFLQMEEDGEIFTKVFFAGAECTLTKTNEVKGTLSAEVAEGNDSAEPTVAASEVIQKLMGSNLTFGAGGLEAQAKSTWKVKLCDPLHEGMALGVSTAEKVEEKAKKGICKPLFLVGKKGSLAGLGTRFEANQVGTSAISVQGRGLGILCETGLITAEFKTNTEALGRAGFEECTASQWVNLENGEAHIKKLPCSVAPIEITKARILPKLHEGEPYLEVEEDGEAFTTVLLTGKECTLPKENKITGTISAQITKGNDTIEPTVAASEAVQKLLGSKLFFGTVESQLKSTWKVTLCDPLHQGKTLGVSSGLEVSENEEEETCPGGKNSLFLVNKESTLAKSGVTFEANQVGKGALSFPSRFAILCEIGRITGEFKTATEALGKAEFKLCTPWEVVSLEEGKIHTKELPCTIDEPIKVEKFKILSQKHEGVPYVLMVEDGGAFTTIFYLGTECALSIFSGSLIGSIAGKIENSDTVEPTILFSQVIQKLLGDKFPLGAIEGYFKSEWKIKLTGTHVGKTVGVR